MMTAFLEDLLEVMNKHNATIGYTGEDTSDWGVPSNHIHLQANGCSLYLSQSYFDAKDLLAQRHPTQNQ